MVAAIASLQPPVEDTLTTGALHELIERMQAPPAMETEPGTGKPSMQIDLSSIDLDLSVPALQIPAKAEEKIDEIKLDLGFGNTPEPASQPASQPADLSAAPAPKAPSGRELRKMHDDIDEQLLPIFLEEAQTLLPQIGSDIRDWKAKPEDLNVVQSLQRGLHTLKGSARMAGAIRLGELTHIMESRVEAAL